jgi:hypothetical protein
VSDTSTPAPQQRLRRAEAAEYLRQKHGIPHTEKTLRNRNAAGLGPKPEYLGTIPFYTPQGLDEYAATAFTPESPVTVTRRRYAEARRSVTPQPAPARRRRKPTAPPTAPAE